MAESRRLNRGPFGRAHHLRSQSGLKLDVQSCQGSCRARLGTAARSQFSPLSRIYLLVRGTSDTPRSMGCRVCPFRKLCLLVHDVLLMTDVCQCPSGRLRPNRKWPGHLSLSHLRGFPSHQLTWNLTGGSGKTISFSRDPQSHVNWWKSA